MKRARFVILAVILLPGAALLAAAQAPQRTIQSAGNPILAGSDKAPADVNDFIMDQWQLFATKDVASRKWLHYPGFLRSEQFFALAAPGRAYHCQRLRRAPLIHHS
jgi:hypothetical protein